MEKRWLVMVHYLSDNGPIDVDHVVEELEEIGALVECGPDWNSIISIQVLLNPKRRSYYTTVEQAGDIVLGGDSE